MCKYRACHASALNSSAPGAYSTAQHSTAQHSTAQPSTAQHSTAQRGTAIRCLLELGCVLQISLNLPIVVYAEQIEKFMQFTIDMLFAYGGSLWCLNLSLYVQCSHPCVVPTDPHHSALQHGVGRAV